MRILITAAAAFGALSLAACGSPAEKAADQKADAIEAQGEQTADSLEKQADVAKDTAEAQGQAQADALNEKADQVEKSADAKADAVRENADGH
ncbi:MAG: hypothetical protein KF842_06225 [Caulobacter sp.]|nr:hypothetical protein [Caulobacter sp.]